MLLILLAVALLGGGGGIGALLGGGSSSGGSGSSTASSGSSGSSASSGSSYSGGSSDFSVSDLSDLLGGSSALDALFGSGSSGYGSSGSSYSSGYGSSGSSYGSGSSSYGSGYTAPGFGSHSSYDYSAYTGSDYGSYYGGSSSSSGSSSYSGGSSSYGSGSLSGSGSGIDLSSLADLFGSSLSQSAAGLTAGWNDGVDNRGRLNTDVAEGSRKKYTRLYGNGKDTVTIMVYMCGTDLESRAGMATSDLTEMAAASISDDINLLVYTGGCTGWKNNIVSSRTNQIYRVRKGGLERLVDDDGDRTMTDPATLSRFIRWCAKNYPANRNELIFWDHGSGSLTGYGYDQKHQSAGSMDLTEINQAIRDGGVTFDFIGFDACLMATAENALSLSAYADYLLASEETEPGTGWYYTDWLNYLSSEPSVPTTQLCKKIIDDFIDVSAQKARGQSTTLSLVDLAELEHTLPASFNAFSKATSSLIQEKEFKTVSTARTSSREFASSSKIDQVDLTDLAWKMGTKEGKELAEVLLGAIKYNRTSSSMCNSYGLSVYFPGSRLSKVDSMVKTYKQLGLDSSYSKCIQEYATVQASGQAASGGTHSVFDVLGGSGAYAGASGGSSYGSSYQSVGTELLTQLVGSLLGGRSVNVEGLDRSNTAFLQESGLSEDIIIETLAQDQFDAGQLFWRTDDNGTHFLRLSEEQWGKISRLNVNMLFDDGSGYIDLGMDNVFQFTSGGDLIGDTDRTWLSIDGQPVAFYHINTVQNGESSVTTGRVPCMLNGERSDLIIVFDAENPYGYIAGARTDYVEGETETLAKAMTALEDGDTLDFLCDYYSYDGTYQDSYYLGEQMTVEGIPVISNTDVGEGGALVSYRLTDLYGQQYWTPMIAE